MKELKFIIAWLTVIIFGIGLAFWFGLLIWQSPVFLIFVAFFSLVFWAFNHLMGGF